MTELKHPSQKRYPPELRERAVRLVLAYVVRSEARVGELLADAARAGATVLRPAAALPWGGYGGSFADPDGHGRAASSSARSRRSPAANVTRSGTPEPAAASSHPSSRSGSRRLTSCASCWSSG
jgi:hypothetical protein